MMSAFETKNNLNLSQVILFLSQVILFLSQPPALCRVITGVKCRSLFIYYYAVKISLFWLWTMAFGQHGKTPEKAMDGIAAHSFFPGFTPFLPQPSQTARLRRYNH